MTQPIQVDVAIVGGGVQGLWVLNDAVGRGYSAVLFERRELGCEQTCHSHVYIHQGHVYGRADGELANRLKEVNSLWSEWLNAPGRRVPYISRQSYFGFQNPADAKQQEDFWRIAPLAYTKVATRPEALLSGSVIKEVLCSPEFCLDGHWLVSELARPQIDKIVPIRSVNRLDVDGATNHLELVMPDSTLVAVDAKAVVLSAGVGNRELLLRAAAGEPRAKYVENLQQVRKSFMLVVHGNATDLPPLTGIFPKLGGLFIVSRVDERSHENVWLVSDFSGDLVSSCEEWLRLDLRSWLPHAIERLRKLSPRAFADLHKLRFSAYEAPKAEAASGGTIPHKPSIQKLRFGHPEHNVWIVWPTKLTLAPYASREIMGEIQSHIGSSGTAFGFPSNLGQQVVAAAKDRWRITPAVSWDEFRECYRLE